MKKCGYSKHVKFKYAKGKTDIYGKMFHDYYEIYLLLGGSVQFTNNHRRQTLQPFQIIVIPPGEYHQFSVTGSIEDYERCVIDIYPEFLGHELLQDALSEKELSVFSESDRIVKHFVYLNECLSSVSEADFSHILPAVATDIVFLIKNSPGIQQTTNGDLCSLSLNLMNYLDEHFTEQIDLDILARKFFCSVSSICHIFKNDYGISIKKYILQKRINAAKMAIQRGEKPEAVSRAYGFVNYSAFYRNYKKNFGVCPSNTNKNTHPQ